MRKFKAVIEIEDFEVEDAVSIDKVEKAQHELLNDTDFDISYKILEFVEIQP